MPAVSSQEVSLTIEMADSPRHMESDSPSSTNNTTATKAGIFEASSASDTSVIEATSRDEKPAGSWLLKGLACWNRRQRKSKAEKEAEKARKQEEQAAALKQRLMDAVGMMDSGELQMLERMYVGRQLESSAAPVEGKLGGDMQASGSLRTGSTMSDTDHVIHGLVPTAMEGMMNLAVTPPTLGKIASTWVEVMAAAVNIAFASYNMHQIPSDSGTWDTIRLTRIVVGVEMTLVLVGLISIIWGVVTHWTSTCAGRSAAANEMFIITRAGITYGQMNVLSFVAYIPAAPTQLAQYWSTLISQAQNLYDRLANLYPRARQAIKVAGSAALLFSLAFCTASVLLLILLGLAGLLTKLALVSHLAGTALTRWSFADVLRFLQFANNLGSVARSYKFLTIKPQRLLSGVESWEVLFDEKRAVAVQQYSAAAGPPHSTAGQYPAADSSVNEGNIEGCGAGASGVDDPEGGTKGTGTRHPHIAALSHMLHRHQRRRKHEALHKMADALKFEPMDVAVHLAIHTHGWFQGFPMMQNLEDRDVLRAFIRQPGVQQQQQQQSWRK